MIKVFVLDTLSLIDQVDRGANLCREHQDTLYITDTLTPNIPLAVSHNLTWHPVIELEGLSVLYLYSTGGARAPPVIEQSVTYTQQVTVDSKLSSWGLLPNSHLNTISLYDYCRSSD